MNRSEKKSFLVRYKGGKCQDCGHSFPDCCFHFDHRDPDQKSFTISHNMVKSLAELIVEVDKCDLVCANDHAIRTVGNSAIAKKRSRAQMGKHPSLKTIEKMKASKKGVKFSPEHIRNNVAAHAGYRHSPETIAKISAAKRKRDQKRNEIAI